MADNDEVSIYNEEEMKARQSVTTKIGDKMEENQLPTPPPSPWSSRSARAQAEMTRMRNLEEDEDILAYLTDLGIASEGQASECPSRNSTTLYSDETFEPLSRLCALTEQILELRDRNSKFFRRVRNLEKLKVLRDADRRLDYAFARNRSPDVREEDTEFAESLLNAMLSNYRDPPAVFQRRNLRSPSSKQLRSKWSIDKQMSQDQQEVSNRAPKISKWTRVKAAFRWERACTNDVETADAPASLPTTAKYLKIQHGEPVNSTNINECYGSAKLLPASSQPSVTYLSNEGFPDYPHKNFSNNLECLSSKTKEGKKQHCVSQRSQSISSDTSILHNEPEFDVKHMNEGRPLIRITSERDQSMHFANEMGRRYTGEMRKKPTLSLTVTIPSHEEEIRCMSSPESNSPLPSSAHTSGGNSPQPRKMHRELPAAKDFKRKQSIGEESVTSTPKLLSQDSKWNKVRRAFLTHSTLSVPVSPTRMTSGQMFFQDGQEVPTAYSYSGSVENLEKITALNNQTDTQRDYKGLREKLGTEFHRKLIEWERLKNLSPRTAMKDAREASFGLLNTQEALLSEVRLAPEFRKKLQDWKRAKKERRGSAPFDQQRINRRRLTDWQVWRSPLKSECKSPEAVAQHGSCGSGESIFNDGSLRLYDDFVRKVETWKKMNETHQDIKHSIRLNSNRHKIASAIDESEFVALEKVISFFNKNMDEDQQECDHQLDECFDYDIRSYPDGTQNTNTNEVLIQTSVGSYRFEGISQEFTRKLYDWEKYRGISPRSSTFRLLGSAYAPLVGETNIGRPTLTTDEIGSDERVLFKAGSLKRSKSVGNLVIEASVNECFVHRATSLSLDYLTDRLKDTGHINTSAAPIDSRRIEGATKHIVIDESEREAMIVDIEDVIEETASPLERVQPHQTPVYSVAASETTSIAVPLGTVTSTRSPFSVFLIETEENLTEKNRECVRSNTKNFSSEGSPIAEEFETSNIQNNKKDSLSEDDVDLTKSFNNRSHYVSTDFDYANPDLSEDSIKADKSIYSTELNERYKVAKELKIIADQNCNDFERRDISTSIFNNESVTKTIIGGHKFDGTNENETIRTGNFGSRSIFAVRIKMSTDLSSEKKHQQKNGGKRVTRDGSGDDGLDVIMAEMKGCGKYEEMTSGAAIDPDRHSLTNCNECPTNSLPGLSTGHTLGETSHIGFGVNSYDAYEVTERLKECGQNRNTDELYDALTTRSNQKQPHTQNACIVEAASKKSIDVKECEQRRKFESVSTSAISTGISPSTYANHCEPTIRTTSLTVSSGREERCFERIIINEETLNKIVVPTASNSCPENIKISKPSTESTNYLTEQHDHDSQLSELSREGSVDQETNVKKQCSPSRNVFIKTKRIIFSPFRRTEDNSVCKKDTGCGDRALLTKSKSKSRSASPKVNRQDVFLRMSFSLPWPLRASKDHELKETALGSDKEEHLEVSNKRRSSVNESNLYDRLRVEEIQESKDKELEEESDSSKYFSRYKENLVDASVQVTPDDQENGALAANNLFVLEAEEQRSVLPSRFDTRSSDLMHKLQILSNAVAERDGRTNAPSESLESHSLRIRRAKEDFLSRRGGPLCHSVMEASPTVHLYEQVSQDQRDTKDKVPKVGMIETSDDEMKDEAEMVVGEDITNGSKSSLFLPDRVKSASVGMINVDPDTFKRLTESNRGCESLPRSISKQQEASGPLAKIVNKFKFARLIRSKDIGEGSMSTISRLCRQSLLIDVRNNLEKQ